MKIQQSWIDKVSKEDDGNCMVGSPATLKDMKEFTACNKLMEAMGWKHTMIGTEYVWKQPNGRIVGGFNPYKYADDCETVIKWLTDEKHITVTVTFGRGVRFDYYIGTRSEIETNDWNWKRAICNLALEVIE